MVFSFRISSANVVAAKKKIPVSQRLLARGSRLTELLKQGQYAPMPVEEQVAVIFGGVRGYLDGIAVGAITRFETELRAALKAKHGDILEAIRRDQEIKPETEAKLTSFYDGFVKSFA
jgi:F-type H+-transporting ATPase subunit alpha